MTTPDPRPYAAPTDLVTAADVARWRLERAERDLRVNCHPSPLVLHYAHADLRARLDRERRQACRRGALDCWRRVTDLVRFARQYRCEDRAWAAHGHGVWHYLTRALAFRAAARAK